MKPAKVTTYKARKGVLIHLLFFLVLALPVLVFLWDRNLFSARPVLLLPLLIPICLMLWVYFDTSYRITDQQLYYRCGFLKGHIAINSIREIIYTKNVWTGVKPALASNGLLIKYKEDQVYVAPVNNERLIEDLLLLNKSIKVTKKS